MAFKMRYGEGGFKYGMGAGMMMEDTPMDKKLVGDQHNLPENLKDKIEASPMKNYRTPGDYKVFNMGNKPSAPIKKKKKGY